MLWTAQWAKVVIDPLGLAGFALLLFFGLVGRVLSQKTKRGTRWLLPAFCGLAAACLLGGLTLAYRRESATATAATPPATAPATSMHIDKIEQKGNGSAVAGVQGNVTVNPSAPPGGANPRK